MSSESPSARPWAGAMVALGVLGMLVLGQALATSEGDSELGILLAIILVALIAGLLVARRPDHPVSWLLALAALVGGVAGVAAELLSPGLTELSWWQVPLAIASGPAWYALLFILLVAIPLLFPTGSPLSPVWRWVLNISVTALLAMSALWVLQGDFCTDVGDTGCLTTVENPIGVDAITNPEESAIGGVFYSLVLLSSVTSVASLVIRYRRSGPIERHQIKWVAFSIGLFVGLTLLVEVLWVDILDRAEPPGYWFVFQLSWVLIPASIAVAILRYRLYDIDRIISRTVTYALVVGTLSLIVAMLAGMAGTRFDDPLIVAVTTLTVATIFNPLRRRVQTLVDRRFNRSRYDAERVVDRFASTLQSRVDPAEVIQGWTQVVSETMQPRAVGTWMRDA